MMNHLEQLRIRQLQLLVWLDGGMTLNAVAARLHVSAAAVSLMLKEIESKLDTVLFERDRRGARPTKAGARLAQRAAVVLREFDAFEQEAAALSKQPVAFALGVIPQVMMQYVPTMMASYDTQMLGPLQVSEGTTRVLVQRVLAGELGAAIVRVGLGSLDERAREALSVEMLGNEQAAIAVPRAHALARKRKIAADELMQLRWVLSSPDSYIRSMFELYLQRNDMRLQTIVLQVDSTVQALWCASRLGCAAVGPLSLIRAMSKAWGLSALPIVIGEPVQLGLVYRRSQRGLPAFTALREVMLDVMSRSI
jgi:DNA-binding transcriptional LysR family regulator